MTWIQRTWYYYIFTRPMCCVNDISIPLTVRTPTNAIICKWKMKNIAWLTRLIFFSLRLNSTWGYREDKIYLEWKWPILIKLGKQHIGRDFITVSWRPNSPQSNIWDRSWPTFLPRYSSRFPSHLGSRASSEILIEHEERTREGEEGASKRTDQSANHPKPYFLLKGI